MLPLNLIESVKIYINMLISYDLLGAKKGSLPGAVFKESKIFKVNEAIPTKKLRQKDGKNSLKELLGKCDQLIEHANDSF